ncbi:hypothetical protein VspSTUT11_16320 [Vibrio sp. STUT-A11]|nr:hypothetical protein VspSTUT11_16320 [Vibrio sp. STUT-A11]
MKTTGKTGVSETTSNASWQAFKTDYQCLAFKYSVTSMSWYTPCLLLAGCSLYRKVYKGLILRRVRLR